MGTPLRWIEFNLFVLMAVALDLGVFHRRPRKLGLREATLWSLAWISLAVLFGIGILRYSGHQKALEFFTGYLLEKSLSADNLFIFLIIFRIFAVDLRLQHRILTWGILGALIMRGAMIAAGAELIEHYSWVLYAFGAFLLYAGIHTFFIRREQIHPERNFLFRFASRHLRVASGYQGERFFVRDGGRLFATPLFLVLLIVEIADITLAVDSIPAVFGITHDPFIVYTSNVFAILGLRALYFLLAGFLDRLRYLSQGLAFVLMFIGAKMIAEPWLHIPVQISLAAVAGMLSIALFASILIPPRKKHEAQPSSNINSST
jgi:tellurite resistance protein TerC